MERPDLPGWGWSELSGKWGSEALTPTEPAAAEPAQGQVSGPPPASGKGSLRPRGGIHGPPRRLKHKVKGARRQAAKG